jgi:hypothetical protein
MKKLISLFAFLLVSGILISQTYVEKVFDFNETDRAYDIIELQEGGFLILASTTENSVGKSVFIRLNENGDTLWIKEKQYYGYSIVQYDTSTFYIAGSYNGGNSYSYGVLNKLNSNFDRIWIKTFLFGNDGDIRLRNLKKNLNNNLTATYYLKLDDENVAPIESIRVFDTSGVVITHFADCMDIADYQQLANTDYVVATKYENGYYPDFVEFRDSSGSLKNKIDVSDLTNGQTEIVLNNDTVYVIGGYDNFKVIDGVVIYRLDPDYDDLSWNMQYASLTGIVSGCNGSDNSILVLGNVDGSRSSAYILNVSSSGDSISTSIIDKFPTIYPVKIISNEESYFMIATIEYEDESRDIYFLKAALDTVLVSVKQEADNSLKPDFFRLSPNPASTYVNLIFTPDTRENNRIIVNNMIGEEVINESIPSGSAGINFDTSTWKPGIYIFALYQKGTLMKTEKVVVRE